MAADIIHLHFIFHIKQHILVTFLRNTPHPQIRSLLEMILTADVEKEQ